MTEYVYGCGAILYTDRDGAASADSSASASASVVGDARLAEGYARSRLNG